MVVSCQLSALGGSFTQRVLSAAAAWVRLVLWAGSLAAAYCSCAWVGWPRQADCCASNGRVLLN